MSRDMAIVLPEEVAALKVRIVGSAIDSAWLNITKTK
jgi:hypothetical protein